MIDKIDTIKYVPIRTRKEQMKENHTSSIKLIGNRLIIDDYDRPCPQKAEIKLSEDEKEELLNKGIFGRY